MRHIKRFLWIALVICLLAGIGAEYSYATEKTAIATPDLFVLRYLPHDPTQTTQEQTTDTMDFSLTFLLSDATLATIGVGNAMQIQLDFSQDAAQFHTDPSEYLSLDAIASYLTTLHFGNIQNQDTRALLGEALFSYKTVRVGSARTQVWSLDPTATIYARMRIVTEQYESGWTDAVSFGKDTTPLPEYPTEFSAPTLSDASLSIEPQSITFSLTVPPQIRAYAALLSVREDAGQGAVSAHFEYTVNGDEYTEAALPEQADILSGGLITVLLPAGTLQDYSFVQLRMYYTIVEPDGTVRATDPSAVVFAKAQAHANVDIPIAQITTPQIESASIPQTIDGVQNRHTCPVCGHCAQPLSVCIFVWLGIVLLIAVIIVLIAAIHFLAAKKRCPRCGKRCRKNAKLCEKCGYRFAAILPLVEEAPSKKKSPRTVASTEFSSTDQQTMQGANGIQIPYTSTGEKLEKEHSAVKPKENTAATQTDIKSDNSADKAAPSATTDAQAHKKEG